MHIETECVVDLSLSPEANADCLIVPQGHCFLVKSAQVRSKISVEKSAELLGVELIAKPAGERQPTSVRLSLLAGGVDDSGRRSYAAALGTHLLLEAGTRFILSAFRSMGVQRIGPAYCHLILRGELLPACPQH